MNQFIGKGTVSLVSFLGAIVLLLWGVRMIRKGVEKFLLPHVQASSPIFNNRCYALMSGLIGSAMLQSSTALVLIVSSVASKISIPLSVGLAFVLGADVGTSIAAQLFSFNIKSIGPLLLFIGFFMQRTAKKEHSLRQIGQILMGFGFVLYGLASIGSISVVFRESEVLSGILSGVLVNDVAFALLVSIMLTWLSHSSLAVVLMTVELVAGQVVPLDLGISLVIGTNIGACLPAYTDSIGLPVETRRLTLGNVIFRITGGLLIMPFLRMITTFAQQSNIAADRFLILFHLAFNVLVMVLFIFFTEPIGKFIMKILPDPKKFSYKGTMTKFLKTQDIKHPDLAITNLKKEVSRMGDNVYVMVDQASFSLENINDIRNIQNTEHTVDSLYRSVSQYLQKVYALSLDTEQAKMCMIVNSYCTDLEQAGDIIANNIAEIINEKHKKHIIIAPQYQKELEKIFNILRENLNLAQDVFRNMDADLALELQDRKNEFKNMTTQISQNYKQKLLTKDTESIAINGIYLDIINDLRRLNTQISTIAHHVIEQKEFALEH